MLLRVARLAGSALYATTFDGVTLGADSPHKIDAPVLSLRVSAAGVELRGDEMARDVAALWRLPWSFIDTWERVDDTELKLSFNAALLRSPPLHLRSAQTPEILSLLDAYYKALIVCRCLRARGAPSASRTPPRRRAPTPSSRATARRRCRC